MCLSEYVADPATKVTVGYGVCGLISIHLIYSITRITLNSAFA